MAPASEILEEDHDQVANLKDTLRRAQGVLDELQQCRAALELKAQKKENAWFGNMTGLRDLVLRCRGMKNAAERTLRAYEAPSRDVPMPGNTARSLSADLTHLENLWTIIKTCTSIISFSRSFELTTASGRQSVHVDAITDNGAEWLKVININEKSLLFQIADAGWVWDDESDDQDQDMESYEEDIGILRVSRQLVEAAREIQKRDPLRIRMILPNIPQHCDSAIERVLSHLVNMGEEKVQLILQRAGSLPTPPPLDVAIANLVPPSSITGLSSTQNLDTSMFHMLTSDVSHIAPNEGQWRKYILEDVLDEEVNGPRLTKDMYPVLGANRLVCTREAAETFLKMAWDAGTHTEIARTRIMLGETLSNPIHDKSEFISRLLNHGDRNEGQDEEIREERRKTLLAELQKLSSYPVPVDLQLPIQVVDSLQRHDVTRLVRAGELPQIALVVEPKLNDTNCSSFFYGWKMGYPTLTCNGTAVRRLNQIVRTRRGAMDAVGPRFWVANFGRALAGRPWPMEELEVVESV